MIREEASARVQQLQYNIAMNLPFPSQVCLSHDCELIEFNI